MFEGTPFSSVFFIVCMIVLSVIIFFCLIIAIRGPRYTDRIVAANMISTKVIAFVCMLAVFLREDFLVDVGLIYAMLGFAAVVVLSRIIQVRKRRADEVRQTLKNGEVEMREQNEEEASDR